MPRLYGARIRSLRRSRISGAPRRADTVRAGLQERVRRVVLHRIRDTHTILADQWRHECDANISIIAHDLSSARFIGARSASPASSPIAGLARRLPASTAQAQPRARLDLPRGRRVPIPGDDIGPHGIGPQLLARPEVPKPRQQTCALITAAFDPGCVKPEGRQGKPSLKRVPGRLTGSPVFKRRFSGRQPRLYWSRAVSVRCHGPTGRNSAARRRADRWRSPAYSRTSAA